MNTMKWIACLAVGALALVGCSNMEEQPKLGTYDESPTFGQAARELEPGVVPVGYLRDDQHLYSGTVDGALAETFPMDITGDVLARGQQVFDAFCTPCHGYSGYGDGVIAQEGFPWPASFHTDALRQMPVGQMFQSITNGKNAMFSYASRVTPEDRWAVIAYIRALQLSQYAPYDSLPPEVQAELQALEG